MTLNGFSVLLAVGHHVSHNTSHGILASPGVLTAREMECMVFAIALRAPSEPGAILAVNVSQGIDRLDGHTKIGMTPVLLPCSRIVLVTECGHRE